MLSQAQRIAKVGSWEADLVTGRVTWSDEMYTIYNCDPATFTPSADSLINLLHPDDRESMSDSIAGMISGNKQTPMEFRLNTADGSVKYICGEGEVFFNAEGKPVKAIGTAQDVTKRKKAEEKLRQSEMQIRSFAKHLNDVLEEERARLAREIHDELGQQLAGIKIGLLSFKTPGHPDIKYNEKINGMLKDVDTSLQSLRKIATQLRPGILDSLGLIPSIEWLVHEFEKKTKIKSRLELHVAEEKFDKNISTCYFRICQEALTNISKHAEASEVTIRITQHEKTLILEVADNGKGMVSGKLNNSFSMGLLGMKERAKNIGGDLSISSKINVGTKIYLKTNLP